MHSVRSWFVPVDGPAYLGTSGAASLNCICVSTVRVLRRILSGVQACKAKTMSKLLQATYTWVYSLGRGLMFLDS